MFEKKTVFGLHSIEQLLQMGSHDGVFYPNSVKEIVQEVADCHAEIDRLNGELTTAKKREDDFCLQFLAEISAAICTPAEGYRSLEWAVTDVKKLVAELTALRAQVPGEWIDVKGNEEKVFEAGTYEYQAVFRDEPFIGAVRFKDSLPLKAYANVTFWTKLRLITRLADFKPEPQPIEVEVGKYQTRHGVGEILCIQGDMCCYRNPLGTHTIISIIKMKEVLIKCNAVFIGEGDNQ